MGRLKDFLSYLSNRQRTLQEIEKSLCTLQEKYESFFAEIERVQESELGQLTEHILADRRALPGWLNEALDQAQKEVDQSYENKLKRLRSDRLALERKAEAVRQRSVKQEHALREKNTDLDRQEEALKVRNERLLQAITEHNRRIRELGQGWGFFSNLFRMRRMAAEKEALEQEQADLLARIEGLRVTWQNTEHKELKRETELQAEWVELTAQAAALQTKIDHLEASWPRMRVRSTIEQVLGAQAPRLTPAGPQDPPCPRCKRPNPIDSHFCQVCALRLGEDRPDLEGSLREMAELNLHHARFSEGMRACQEIIGLVRGLRTGVEAFSKSVEDVLDSEKRYPLPKLQIDIPAAAKAYGESFDTLREKVGQDLSLHPQDFAGLVGGLVGEVFTEEKIKTFFETMGQELSRQAEAQW